MLIREVRGAHEILPVQRFIVLGSNEIEDTQKSWFVTCLAIVLVAREACRLDLRTVKSKYGRNCIERRLVQKKDSPIVELGFSTIRKHGHGKNPSRTEMRLAQRRVLLAINTHHQHLGVGETDI